MRVSLIYFSLSIALFSTMTMAQAKTITVTTPEWTSYTQKDGRGYYASLLRAIYQPLGIAINYKYVPYSRAKSQLMSEEADVLLSSYAGEFDASWYSEHAVSYDLSDVAISRDLDKIWVGVETLKGLRVAARYGYGYDKFLHLDAEYTEVRTEDALIKMLAAGRVDAVIDTARDLNRIIKAIAAEDKLVVKLAVYKAKTYFVFNDSPAATQYKKIFDLGMARLRASGELREIMLRELGDDSRYVE